MEKNFVLRHVNKKKFIKKYWVIKPFLNVIKLKKFFTHILESHTNGVSACMRAYVRARFRS